jgi:hypothetical protein
MLVLAPRPVVGAERRLAAFGNLGQFGLPGRLDVEALAAVAQAVEAARRVRVTWAT